MPLAPSATPTTPARVVLVEDDLTVALVTTALLEHDGAIVDHVTSAEAALERLAVGPRPDVLLTDLHLPGATGIDLCRQLRSDPTWSALPILLITVADAQEIRLQALDEGADDLLTKPVQPVELRARVRSLARLSRARRQLDVRRRLDAVVEQVSDGVVVLDAHGSVRSANARARQLLGLTSATSGDLLDDVTQRFELVDDRRPIEGPDRIVEVHRPRRDTEQPLWLTLTVLPIPDDPEAARVVVVRDVTDERAATNLADVVLSSVAHKLRTPLTNIVSTASLLSRVLADSPYLDLVQSMERNVDRLDDTLLRILDHASMLAGANDTTQVCLTPESLTSIAADGSPALVAAVEGARNDLGHDVVLPAAAVRTTVEEFVGNAVANGDDAPVLHVAVEGREVVVAVEDRGDGFPPEDVDRLFSPFFQVDRTGQAPGVGLGLPLVAHVVARAGGRTRAASGPDGTRFEARFPVRTVRSRVGSYGMEEVPA